MGMTPLGAEAVADEAAILDAAAKRTKRRRSFGKDKLNATITKNVGIQGKGIPLLHCASWW